MRSGRPASEFQSTPPCGGRPTIGRAIACDRSFQSTPPCGGRPVDAHVALPVGQIVSIHAPVRGATQRSGGQSASDWSVSIHAPVRGATPTLTSAWHAAMTFQSTPPCGGRPRTAELARIIGYVSIHAPVRGATLPARSVHASDCSVSIHAPVRGATRSAMCRTEPAYVSIHAPVRGATTPRVMRTDAALVSIHAPVRGATSGHPSRRPVPDVSIHAPVRGATLARSCVDCRCSDSFNPRPRAGGDARCPERRVSRSMCFNPRPRAGGD